MAITARITDTSRAIQVLEGFFKGIAADKVINPAELQSLKTWLDNHKNHSHVFPFCDAYEMVGRILEDGIIDQGEHDELIDFCESFEALDGPIDRLTTEMRNLHGFLHGIIADRKVNYQELKALEKWMLYHDHNSNVWPFNDVYNLIERILEDGIVSKAEQEELVSFVSGFMEEKAGMVQKDASIFVGYWLQSDAPALKTIDNIVSRGVRIDIGGNSFCFTGQMRHGKRKDICLMLENKGGIATRGITSATDYLVIGALSNPCWAYSTYGRKIEMVMNSNQEGGKTVIIHEDDFWRALNQ